MANNWLEMLNECLARFNQSRDWPAFEAGRAQLLKALSAADATDPEVELRLLELARSGDGYLREAAVRQLGKGSSAAAWQVLIERRNDWVPQVRQAALSSAEAFLRADRLPVVLASLGATLRLSGKSRMDHSGFIERVGAFVDQPENRSVVLAFYPKSRGPAASFLLSRLLRWEGEVVADVVRLSTWHKDLIVRSRFLGACLVQGAVGQEALRALLDDPYPGNRQKAFLALWQGDLSSAERASLLPKALLDPSGSVRDVALWAARQSGFDLAGFVVAQGKGESLNPRAYLGWLHLLGVLGKDNNLPLIQAAFADARPKVRQAALLAWVAVSRDTADEPIVQAMLDDSPKVAKLAGQLLRKGKVALSGCQLQWIGEQLEKRGDFGRLLVFSQRLPYWERLVHLLELLPRCVEVEVRAQIVGELVAWLPRQRYGLASLPAEQQERVRRAMRESGLLDVSGQRASTKMSWEQFV
jgi:hypothetical protein